MYHNRNAFKQDLHICTLWRISRSVHRCFRGFVFSFHREQIFILLIFLLTIQGGFFFVGLLPKVAPLTNTRQLTWTRPLDGICLSTVTACVFEVSSHFVLPAFNFSLLILRKGKVSTKITISSLKERKNRKSEII